MQKVKPVWTWGDKLDQVDHGELDQFISNEVASEPCSTERLLSLYDGANDRERMLIDAVTIALTGWSVESLLNNSQGAEE